MGCFEMDRCIALAELAALITTLIPLTQGASIGEEGGVRREPTVNCSLKPYGRHKKAGDFQFQPYKQGDCLPDGRPPPSVNTQTVLTNSNRNIISTTWRLPRKVSLFVMHVGYVTENNTQSEECHQFNITGYGVPRESGKRRLHCKYERTVSVTKSRPFNFTIVWGVGNLPIAVRSFNKKTHGEEGGPIQRSTGCYDWRPQTFVLHPSNTDVKVTWSPAFTMSGLVVSLYDKENGKIIAERDFKSWETIKTNITEHTFHDVKARRYEGRMKPTGCKDCPNYSFDLKCSPDPVATEIVHKDDTDVETDGVDVVSMSKDNSLLDNNTLLIMSAAIALAVFSIVITAVMCYCRDYVCRTKVLPRQPKSGPPTVTTRSRNKDKHHEGHRFRIVVLYGVDHFQHIAAVMAFAKLLRKLLNVEVVLEREQGRSDTCNIADWLATSLTPSTMVIVVASEALYQLSCGQDARKRDLISRVTGDMFAMYSPLALRYLQEENFSNHRVFPDVLLVSFGYQDTSPFKLMDSFRLLFKGVHFEVTEMKEGARSPSITDLLRFLAVDERNPDFTTMEEMEEFLSSVSRMDEHIRVNGSAWWENVIDSSSYNSDMSELRDEPRHVDLNIDTETFSVFSEVTTSSAVTVNFLCKRCRVSSCHTLPSDASRLSPTLSDPRPAVWGSSCLTLHVPETDSGDTNDLFAPEAPESTALLQSVVTAKNMDFEETLNCDSCILIPEHHLDVLGHTASSVPVEVASREC